MQAQRQGLPVKAFSVKVLLLAAADRGARMQTVDNAFFRPGIPPSYVGLHSTVLPGRGAGQLREMTGNAACQLPCSSGRTLLGIGSGLTLALALSICLPGGLGSREGPRRAVSFWADSHADIGPGAGGMTVP